MRYRGNKISGQTKKKAVGGRHRDFNALYYMWVHNCSGRGKSPCPPGNSAMNKIFLDKKTEGRTDSLKNIMFSQTLSSGECIKTNNYIV